MASRLSLRLKTLSLRSLLSPSGMLRPLSTTPATHLREILRHTEPDGTLTVQGKRVPSEKQENLLQIKDPHGACALCALEAKGIHLKYTDVLPLSQFLHPDTKELLERAVLGVCKWQYRKLKSMVQMAQRAHILPSTKEKIKWEKFNTYFEDEDVRTVHLYHMNHLKEYRLGGKKAIVPLKKEFRRPKTPKVPSWFAEPL